MKALIWLCCSTVLLSNIAVGQIRPRSDGGCGVSPRGLMDCSWASAVAIRKPSTENAVLKEASNTGRIREFSTNRYNLAPGAMLDATSDGYDRFLVALNDGSLKNDAQPPHADFVLMSGSALLLSKGEKYSLRNAGDKDLQVLLILISK